MSFLPWLFFSFYISFGPKFQGFIPFLSEANQDWNFELDSGRSPFKVLTYEEHPGKTALARGRSVGSHFRWGHWCCALTLLLLGTKKALDTTLDRKIWGALHAA